MSFRNDPTVIIPKITASPSIARVPEFDALRSHVHVFGQHFHFKGLKGEDYFNHKRNIGYAVSSILLKVAKETNFQPGITGLITDNDAYNKFTGSIPLHYFEDGQGFQRTCLIELDGTMDQFVTATNAKLGLGMCSGIPEALRKVFPKTLSKDGSQRRWLLQLITIKQVFENCPVVVQFGQLSLNLKGEGNNVEIEPQTATLVVTGYIADEYSFRKSATTLEDNVEKKTTQDFIDTITTKEDSIEE
ncbi:hypothetical protein BGZ76_007206 [Entomortierella beljakovae]|nr:hypothetical protein BGZ76_007206 [Entomortierella beljakovae]